MPPTLKIVPTATAQRATQTKVDTIVVTPTVLKEWKSPPFQRPLRTNAKVIALSEKIKVDGGVLPGIVTVGIFDRVKYLLDGQHRREAFLISECKEGFVDVRYATFDSMAEMGEEFVNLNSSLVRLRPDDILRGLEGTSAALTFIKKSCTYVGYDQIRRGDKAPILSMNQLLRNWRGSAAPTPSAGGVTAVVLAQTLTLDDARLVVDFLNCVYRAWGRDHEYGRLWNALNLTLCMWLWRNTVTGQFASQTTKVTKEMFTKCLMSLSANEHYLSWLVGQPFNDHSRSPAYTRLKAIFGKRINEEMGKLPRLPSPPWSTNTASKKR